MTLRTKITNQKLQGVFLLADPKSKGCFSVLYLDLSFVWIKKEIEGQSRKNISCAEELFISQVCTEWKGLVQIQVLVEIAVRAARV